MNKDLIIQKQKELIGKYLKTNIHININGDYSDYQRLKDEIHVLESEQKEPVYPKSFVEYIAGDKTSKGTRIEDWYKH